MKYFKADICKSFDDGHYPSTFQDFGVILSLKAENMRALIGKIKDHVGADSLEVFENRLETSTLENSDGYPASASMIERWKSGDVTLFCANYSAYISEVNERELTENELNEALK